VPLSRSVINREYTRMNANGLQFASIGVHSRFSCRFLSLESDRADRIGGVSTNCEFYARRQLTTLPNSSSTTTITSVVFVSPAIAVGVRHTIPP
jgi:hypothetical protein